MGNITILQKTGNYMTNSLMERLKGLGYQTSCVEAALDSMMDKIESSDVLLLYLDNSFLNDRIAVEYIKDVVMREKKMVFLVGDEDDIRIVEKVIPRKKITERYKRPIDVNEISASMDEIIRLGIENIKRKILVVDDSGAMLRNVKGWLSDKYDVVLANSGEFAMRYLTSGCPDLVLLDYEMPGMSGKDVLQAIRSDERLGNLPVIFLTSKGEKENVMEVMSLKPEGYILKTEEPAKIVQRIDEFFDSAI